MFPLTPQLSTFALPFRPHQSIKFLPLSEHWESSWRHNSLQVGGFLRQVLLSQAIHRWKDFLETAKSWFNGLNGSQREALSPQKSVSVFSSSDVSISWNSLKVKLRYSISCLVLRNLPSSKLLLDKSRYLIVNPARTSSWISSNELFLRWIDFNLLIESKTSLGRNWIWLLSSTRWTSEAKSLKIALSTCVIALLLALRTYEEREDEICLITWALIR